MIHILWKVFYILRVLLLVTSIFTCNDFYIMHLTCNFGYLKDKRNDLIQLLVLLSMYECVYFPTFRDCVCSEKMHSFLNHFLLFFIQSCVYSKNSKFFSSLRIREKRTSVTILLCGTSGCGKSTLSTLLVFRTSFIYTQCCITLMYFL